jgi:hypothetical protein
MRNKLLYLLNGGLFYFGWFAGIAGAAARYHWISPLVFMAILAVHLRYFGDWVAELKVVLFVCTLGCLCDTAYINLGLIRFASIGFVPPFIAPLWVVSLYGMFGITLNHSLSWLKKRLILSIPLGVAGGIISYLAGLRMGVAELLVEPWIALSAIGLVWAVITPVILLFVKKVSKE